MAPRRTDALGPCGPWLLGPDCGHDIDAAPAAFDGLTTYVRHVLWRAGYHTCEALRAADDARLLRVRQVGRGSLAQVRAAFGREEVG